MVGEVTCWVLPSLAAAAVLPLFWALNIIVFSAASGLGHILQTPPVSSEHAWYAAKSGVSLQNRPQVQRTDIYSTRKTQDLWVVEAGKVINQ